MNIIGVQFWFTPPLAHHLQVQKSATTNGPAQKVSHFPKVSMQLHTYSPAFSPPRISTDMLGPCVPRLRGGPECAGVGQSGG